MARKWLRRTITIVAAAGLALTAAGCSEGGRAETGAGAVETEEITIAMVTHGAPGDTFFDIIRRGAETAAAKDNVNFLYSSHPDGREQAQFIDQYVDQDVDGLIVALANPDSVATAIQGAVDAGIPVVAINAGVDRYDELGALAYFGSDDYTAAIALAERMQEDGIEHPVCLNQQQGAVNLEIRCSAIQEVIPDAEVLYFNGQDMTDLDAKLTAKLQTDSSVDAIVGLGAPFTLPSIDIANAVGSDAQIFSFDITTELGQAIVDGTVQYTIDQQPYLQGYLPVDAIWLYHLGGFELGGGEPVLTGPTFVDSDNAEQAIEYLEGGLR